MLGKYDCRGGENMKKKLTKKVKTTSNAIHYFSGENLTTAITTTVVDQYGYVISVSTSSCPC